MDELATLRRRVEELEAENAELRAAFTFGAAVAHAGFQPLGLSPLPSRLLRAIAAASPDIAKKGALLALLSPDGRSEDNLHRQLLLVRRALRPRGITVGSIYSVGYFLSADDKARLDALLAQNTENEA